MMIDIYILLRAAPLTNWSKNIAQYIQILCQHYEYYIILMFDNYTQYMSYV